MLLAWLGYAPSTLGAGCARHLVGSAAGQVLFDATASLESSLLGLDPTVPDSPVPPVPRCKGAFCSGGTPLRIPSVPRISVGTQEAWLGRFLGLALSASRGPARSARERLVIPQVIGDGVFHPPRLGSV